MQCSIVQLRPFPIRFPAPGPIAELRKLHEARSQIKSLGEAAVQFVDISEIDSIVRKVLNFLHVHNRHNMRNQILERSDCGTTRTTH